MVRVVIDDYLVTIPVPTSDITDVARGNAKVESVEPEAIGSASGESPDMARAKTAGEAPVFPGAVGMITRVSAAGIVTHPAITGIYVRDLRVAGAISEMAVILTDGGGLLGCVANRCGSALRRLRVKFGVALIGTPLFVSLLASPLLRERAHTEQA